MKSVTKKIPDEEDCEADPPDGAEAQCPSPCADEP